MKSLNRIQVGNFYLEDAITIENLENNINNNDFLNKNFIDLEKVFKNSKKIVLDDRKLKLFINGVMLTQKQEDGIYTIYNNNNFIGIGVIKEELLKRDIVL